MIKQTFLILYIVQSVWLINVLLKIDYFERSLIPKNVQNKKNSKEQNSKEKNEVRKNVIWSNDLVPTENQKSVLSEIDNGHLTNNFYMNSIIIWGHKNPAHPRLEPQPFA